MNRVLCDEETTFWRKKRAWIRTLTVYLESNDIKQFPYRFEI